MHGFTIFRLLRHSGLLERIIPIGAELAGKLTPVLHASYSFDEAPEAIEALARAEHVGKIMIAI
jgi:NADPH:quinone reductase-like Zn-dependent oxidoreductase